MQLPGDALALVGYALAGPFTLWPPLFKRMWRRNHRLFAVQEAGVALIVTGWALRGDRVGVAINAAYGLGLAVAYGYACRRRTA